MPNRFQSAEATAFRAAAAERLSIVRRVVEPVQAEAARRVGVKPNVWFRYERGQRDIDPYLLTVFCIQYDVCPRWVLMGDVSGLRPGVAANLRLIPEAAKHLPEQPRRGDPRESRRSAAPAA